MSAVRAPSLGFILTETGSGRTTREGVVSLSRPPVSVYPSEVKPPHLRPSYC
jgi:hypothetical protein